ncbi:PAS domain-containing protein [Desulfomarina sp.]
MLSAIRKREILTTLIILCEFIIFTLVFFSKPVNLQPDALNENINSLWPIIFLYGGVLLTFFYFFRQADRNILTLQTDLTEQKETNKTLKNQYEETIEKRIFELQVINGTLNREIAERIQAEEEIRELQKQLSLILDSAGEGIFGLDNRGKVIFMNQAASVMLGWKVEELIGQSHHELVHHTHPNGDNHPEEDCPIYMAYRDGLVHYNSEDVFWCKNGSSFPVEYISTPIRDRGMLTGAVVVFRDLNTFN